MAVLAFSRVQLILSNLAILGVISTSGLANVEAFTTPQAGAVWAADMNPGQTAGFGIRLENASLTIEGFSEIGCVDGSMIVVGDSSTLIANDCTFTGTSVTNTAAIDTGVKGTFAASDIPPSNVTIRVSNSQFQGNSRGILTRNVQGTSELTLSNTHFVNNTAWPIEYRVGAGDHTMTLSDSSLQWTANTPVRLYAFHNTSPALTTNFTVNIDRTLFTLVGGARACLVMGGVETVSNPGSSWQLTVTNSVFDLRSAAAFTDTAALNALPETTRRGTALFQHSTILIGNSFHSGVFWRGGPGNVLTMLNCIVDGVGTALKNDGTGSVTSGTNLFNTTTAIGGSGGAMVSGSEIIGVSPLFVDAAAGDFRLELESPAAGVGEDLGVIVDFDGLDRPNPAGSLPDLGAFEVGSAVVPAELGDINEDGVINVADVTALAILLAGQNPPAASLGDVNDDGEVNAQDLEALAESIVNQP